MIKRIYFDNSFFNSRLAQINPKKFAQRFESIDLQWCFSEELLLELFASIEKLNQKKHEEMMRWASVCLALWPRSNIFRNYGRIIFDELENNFSNMFYGKEDVESVKAIFDGISKGILPNDISSAWKKKGGMNNDDKCFYSKLDGFRKKGAKKITEQRFQEIVLKNMLNVNSSKDLDKRISEVTANLDVLPFTRTFLSTAYSISYNKTGKKREFDQRHLIYASNVDYLITDDADMINFAHNIFQNRPSVLMQDKFFNLIQIK